MRFAENKIMPDRVNVYLNILETLMKVVDQNVRLIQIVHQTEPVFEVNVKILAREPVVKMQFVK